VNATSVTAASFSGQDRPQDVDGVLHCLELALALSGEPAEEELGSDGGD
jgi:hypothetical protein